MLGWDLRKSGWRCVGEGWSFGGTPLPLLSLKVLEIETLGLDLLSKIGIADRAQQPLWGLSEAGFCQVGSIRKHEEIGEEVGWGAALIALALASLKPSWLFDESRVRVS